jgi:hypothetical protein
VHQASAVKQDEIGWVTDNNSSSLQFVSWFLLFGDYLGHCCNKIGWLTYLKMMDGLLVDCTSFSADVWINEVEKCFAICTLGWLLILQLEIREFNASRMGNHATKINKIIKISWDISYNLLFLKSWNLTYVHECYTYTILTQFILFLILQINQIVFYLENKNRYHDWWSTRPHYCSSCPKVGLVLNSWSWIGIINNSLAFLS